MPSDDWERVIERDLKDLKAELAAQQKEIDDLKLWRSWVIGSAVTVGMFVGAFGKQLAAWVAAFGS